MTFQGYQRSSVSSFFGKHICDLLSSVDVGDGNCLFNAISIMRKGDMSISTELRLLCALEIILHDEFYKSIHDKLRLDAVSVPIFEACRDAMIDRKWSSVWHVMGCATILDRPIISVYPPVNGVADVRRNYILSRTFLSRCTQEGHERDPLTLTLMRNKNVFFHGASYHILFVDFSQHKQFNS